MVDSFGYHISLTKQTTLADKKKTIWRIDEQISEFSWNALEVASQASQPLFQQCCNGDNWNFHPEYLLSSQLDLTDIFRSSPPELESAECQFEASGPVKTVLKIYHRIQWN